MILESIDATSLAIPFKTAFKHASAERAETQTVWVAARSRSGNIGFGEGCPRDYVTAESLASAQVFVAARRNDLPTTIDGIASLEKWVGLHRADIDRNPAAWSAVELALLDLLGKERQCSVEALLGLPELRGEFRYTAVLGDAAPRQFEAQLAQYAQAGFRDFKIKLSGELERDMAKVSVLKSAGLAAQTVRADANNLWADAGAAIAHLEALDFRFAALEEPLGVDDVAGMRRIAAALHTSIILDESLLRAEQLAQFAESPDHWVVNLRISKMGGLLRSLALAREIRTCGLRLIVGAHVGETSLLTRAALTVASGARDILLAQEGAFGTHLLTYDVMRPPLMFGPGGVLDVSRYGIAGEPGFGIKISMP